MTTRDVIERCSFVLPQRRSDGFVRLARGFELNAEDSSGINNAHSDGDNQRENQVEKTEGGREGGCGGGNGKD